MDAFYTALPYVLIFVQAFGPAMLARRLAIRGSTRSKWTLAFLTSLPIPALVAAFAVFGFREFLAGLPKGCAVDSCMSDQAAFTTLIVSALALYILGFFNALLGFGLGKNSREAR